MTFPTARELFDYELARARKTRDRRQDEVEHLYQNEILTAYNDYHRLIVIERERDLKFLRKNM